MREELDLELLALQLIFRYMHGWEREGALGCREATIFNDVYLVSR